MNVSKLSSLVDSPYYRSIYQQELNNTSFTKFKNKCINFVYDNVVFILLLLVISLFLYYKYSNKEHFDKQYAAPEINDSNYMGQQIIDPNVHHHLYQNEKELMNKKLLEEQMQEQVNLNKPIPSGERNPLKVSLPSEVKLKNIPTCGNKDYDRQMEKDSGFYGQNIFDDLYSAQNNGDFTPSNYVDKYYSVI